MSRTLHLFGTDWCAMMVPIQVIRWYRMQCYDGTDSCATVVPIRRYCHFVTEKNKEVWRRYLVKLIKKHLKAEVMNTPEFREIETMVSYEKLVRIKNDEQRKRMMERQRYWARMERPRINYIPKGLSVDYEEEYSKYLLQEVSFEPRDNDDFTALLRLLERWHKKSIPQILAKNRPDAAYAIAMTLCKHIPLLINRDDIQELIGEYKR